MITRLRAKRSRSHAILQYEYPIAIERYGFLPDTGGPGRFRGGLALVRQYRFLEAEGVLQLRTDRRRFLPYGLAGGRPGTPSANLLNPGGEARELPGKCTITVRRGDVFRHVLAGAGGWGDPLERDPERVGQDFAELVAVTEGVSLTPKPANLTFEEAAAVPVAGLTALQALRDKGSVQPGHEVLINGAAGGVGTFTVQIAKSMGAHVTAVCSTKNVDLVSSLRADEVVDYTQEDFTRGVPRYDLMIDVAGSRPWSEVKRVLRPNATVVIVGGPKANRMLGPLGHMLGMTAGALIARQRTTFFISKENVQDLMTLKDMIEAGRLKVKLAAVFPLQDAAQAQEKIEDGHTEGKIVLKI